MTWVPPFWVVLNGSESSWALCSDSKRYKCYRWLRETLYCFLICWTSCLEGGVIFQLQENHEKEIFCCCLTDFHTDKWKQSMEVTSPRTSIFPFSRVKIPSLEWDQLYWETELEFRYLHWYGGLLHTAYRTCNQSCLDNTDISLSLWEPSQCDRLPVDSCSHICHTCNPNFESFFFHSKRWN